MRRYLLNNHKGFMSTYFLVLLMMACQICFVIITNDIKKIQTIMNLKEDQNYFKQEIQIISNMKQELQRNPLQQTTIEEYVSGQYEELIIMYLNQDGNEIIDYETIRY